MSVVRNLTFFWKSLLYYFATVCLIISATWGRTRARYASHSCTAWRLHVEWFCISEHVTGKGDEVTKRLIGVYATQFQTAGGQDRETWWWSEESDRLVNVPSISLSRGNVILDIFQENHKILNLWYIFLRFRHHSNAWRCFQPIVQPINHGVAQGALRRKSRDYWLGLCLAPLRNYHYHCGLVTLCSPRNSSQNRLGWLHNGDKPREYLPLNTLVISYSNFHAPSSIPRSSALRLAATFPKWSPQEWAGTLSAFPKNESSLCSNSAPFQKP